MSNAQEDEPITKGWREQADALLRAIIDAIPDGLFFKGRDSRFILANTAVAKVMGASDPRDLIGKTDHDFYPKDMADEFLADERRVLSKGERIEEKPELKTVAGKKRWMLVTKLPVFDSKGRTIGLVGICHDVTDRMQKEEELQNERNRLRTLIDMLPHSIYMKDTACRKTMANAIDLAILGCGSEAEAIGKTDFDFFPAEVAELFHHDDQEVLQSGKPVIDREEYYVDPEGHKRWLFTSKVPMRDVEGKVVGLIGVGRDITAIKEREAKIREQAQLLDLASDAITVRDDNNRIRFWNKSAERNFGWAAQEAIGKDEDELLHARRPGEPKEAFRLVMDKGVWVGDLHYVTKDGREILGEARWTLIRDEIANSFSILCVSTDVTERRAVQAQLLRAQRLESLGTLAGGIAHDLNNVLTPIISGLETITPSITDEGARHILSTVVRSAQRGAGVVKQVLGFARGLEGEHKQVAIQAVLEEVVGIVRETFPKSIEVLLQAPADLPPIMGSATQLHQILMNLCVNARDAMPEGGRLAISARSERLDESYARMHLGAKPIAYVLMEVEDTGTGMTLDVVDKIFDPFFTTKPPGKGTGLGLSTALTIVKAHGGFINVYSEPGRGSSFKVYLPAAEPAGAGSERGSLEVPASGTGEIILVVDDEEAVRETTKWALEQRGYRVVLAADGTEAVATFVERRKEIRCVIVDMMMPHMDGAATIRTIRRIEPGVRMIATSGLPSNGYIAEARGLGAHAFVAKPYSTELLVRTVSEVLGAEKTP
jgi:two-component system cell cycle sensor histidine kinase/response regulator CckA